MAIIAELIPYIASILALGLTYLGLREKRSDIAAKVNSICSQMLSTLKQDNVELRATVDELEQKIDEYRDRIDESREEIAEQRAIIESLLRDKAESARKMSEMERNIAMLEAQAREAQRRIETLATAESWRLQYIQYLLQGIRQLMQQIRAISNGECVPAFDPVSFDQYMLDNS